MKDSIKTFFFPVSPCSSIRVSPPCEPSPSLVNQTRHIQWPSLTRQVISLRFAYAYKVSPAVNLEGELVTCHTWFSREISSRAVRAGLPPDSGFLGLNLPALRVAQIRTWVPASTYLPLLHWPFMLGLRWGVRFETNSLKYCVLTQMPLFFVWNTLCSHVLL